LKSKQLWIRWKWKQICGNKTWGIPICEMQCPPQEKTRNGEPKSNMRRKTTQLLMVMGLGMSALTLGAQENRKVLNNPTPTYPETARQFRVSGVVKVEVVIAPNGQIKDVKVIGGHPLLVNAVQETLKNWKYAPASSETTATLIFNFRP
jgi:TonB family protein